MLDCNNILCYVYISKTVYDLYLILLHYTIGNVIGMLSGGYFGVISPEGAASILGTLADLYTYSVCS